MTERDTFTFDPQDSDDFVAKKCTGVPRVYFVETQPENIQPVLRAERKKPIVTQDANFHPALKASDIRGTTLSSSLREVVRYRKGN